MKVAVYWTAALVIAAGFYAHAQETTAAPTPLAALITEAKANNSQIAAANHAWKAATHLAQQAAVLPDPQLTIQSLSVGSPKPFAGFSNNSFAYIGLGASQDIPYPGKLRLKSELANREANIQEAQTGLLRSSIIEQVKLLYLRLSYLQATLSILHQNDGVLKSLIESSLSRYSLGLVSQSDVLKAQIEHTKILRQLTMHHQEKGQTQAELKELLHRPQTSPDIVPQLLELTPFPRSADELQRLLLSQNPSLAKDTASIHREESALRSAQRESKPDFNVGYMFQQTGTGFPDYYMLTINMRLPRGKRVKAEVATAAESLEGSRLAADADMQRQLAEVQKQFIAVTETTELVNEYREGLMPQSEAAFRAVRTRYKAGKEGFEVVLSSLLDELTVEHDYQQALLDHETALARLETLTGAALR